MKFPFGRIPDQHAWGTLKSEIRRVLYPRRARSKLITYGQLTPLLSIPLEPNSTELRFLLGEVCREDDAAGLGMTPVLVVHDEGNGRPGIPGSGFWEVAAELGRDVTDRDTLFVQELRLVAAGAKEP